MKTLILLLCIVTLVSCNKKEDDDVANTLPYKGALTSWDVPNGAWQMRLDLNGANLAGTAFVMVIKFADASEVHCAATVLAGSEGAGSYQTGACTVGVAGPMANGTGGTSFQSFGVGGTYTNDGTNMITCKNGNGCFT